MTVFTCAGCGAVLTAPVTEVDLPAHAHQMWGHELLPALMEPGTCAVDPEPSGPPWRRWSEIGPEEAAARGVYAPVWALSDGPAGAIAVAPGDTRGMVLIPDRLGGLCCGLDGRDGPNLACEQCKDPVATRVDDCGQWHVVWLQPTAVRGIPGAAGFVEPASVPPLDARGHWDPRWEAEVAVTLAHLVAASAGRPLTVPDGLATAVFGPALRILLPDGPAAMTVGLTGPGDIPVVPRGSGPGVPLAPDLWEQLTSPRIRVPGDSPPGPWSFFRPHLPVFLHTLARIPAVREPWLREIYDRMAQHRLWPASATGS